MNVRFARSVGIAVDHRRRNKSVESLQVNTQRLKEYKSKLIIFPRHPNKKLRKGEATVCQLFIMSISFKVLLNGCLSDQILTQEEERKVAVQLKGEVLPIKQIKKKEKLRPVTAKEKRFRAFSVVKQVRTVVNYSDMSLLLT